MEQLNRLTRSLRRARTVELPEGEAPGERALHFSEAGGRGESAGGAGARPAGAGAGAGTGTGDGDGLSGGVRSERKCVPRGPGPALGKGAVAPRTGSGWGRAGFA
jgi:hypothetical protein